MARRGDHTSEQLKDLVVAAGRKLIQEDGFENFSARKVAREIGYTVGTLYHLYGDYDSIIFHINGKTLDIIWEDLEKIIQSNGNKVDKLKKLSWHYYNYAHEYTNLWQALFLHVVSEDKQRPQWYLDKFGQIFSEVQKLIGKERPKFLARTYWAGLHGLTQLSISNKLGTEDLQEQQQMVELYMNKMLGEINV